MKKEYINPYQIVRVAYIEKHETDWIEYRESVKLFGYTIKNRGFYDGMDRMVSSEKTPILPTYLSKHYTIDWYNKKAYEKDRVVIEFSNGTTKEKYFDDKHSALKYLNFWKRKANLI